MNKKIVKIISVTAAICLLLCCFVSCTEKKGKIALELKNDKGKVTGEIDQKLFSLIVSVVNYQLGADALTDEMWSMEYQEGNDTTVKEIVIAQSTAYAKGLLQAESLCDNVYEIGLSDKQKDSIEKYISELVSVYGSKKEFENAISVYGADAEALTRYMELVLKQDTVYESFYSENGIRRQKLEAEKPGYFKEHFAIADHILIKYSAGTKDDGTEIPVTEEEKAAKRELAKTLYNEITNGVRDFDEALAEFNQDTYKLGYPFGYFVPDSFYWSSISTELQDAVTEMEEGEIRFVDTENGAYIVRRNAMDSSLYASNGGFETYLDSVLAQEDFLAECEKAGEAVIYDEIIGELNPANIPSFNIDALGA